MEITNATLKTLVLKAPWSAVAPATALRSHSGAAAWLPHSLTLCKIPREVYRERQSEILRSAQNDKRRAQDDSEGLGTTRCGN